MGIPKSPPENTLTTKPKALLTTWSRHNLKIKCAYVLAYDFLFWNQLRTAGAGDEELMCLGSSMALAPPAGSGTEMVGAADDAYASTSSSQLQCSGHGVCESGSVCRCDPTHTGEACEHEKHDLLLAAGRYRFELWPGAYRYFRIKIPGVFRGGYLKLHLKSRHAVAALFSLEKFPTKAEFQESNFVEWLLHKKDQELRFPIPRKQVMEEEMAREGRGTQKFDQGGVGDVFYGAPGPSSSNSRTKFKSATASTTTAASAGKSIVDQCPSQLDFTGSNEVCGPSESLKFCEDQCMQCVMCSEEMQVAGASTVPGASSSSSGSTANCTQSASSSCSACLECVPTLQKCGKNLDCKHSPVSKSCTLSCATCMGSCLLSNDENCGECGCCEKCLPWSVVCGNTAEDAGVVVEDEFAYLAVYNHRMYYNEGSSSGDSDSPSSTWLGDFSYTPAVEVDAELEVVEDPEWWRASLDGEEFSFSSSSSTTTSSASNEKWLSALYNPFQSIDEVKALHGDEYSGNFVYHLSAREEAEKQQEIDVYRDRVTLLKLYNPDRRSGVRVRFGSSRKSNHEKIERKKLVFLFSTSAAPKTLFDFRFAAGTEASGFPMAQFLSSFFTGEEATQHPEDELFAASDTRPKADNANPSGGGHGVAQGLTIPTEHNRAVWCAIFSVGGDTEKLRVWYQATKYMDSRMEELLSLGQLVSMLLCAVVVGVSFHFVRQSASVRNFLGEVRLSPTDGDEDVAIASFTSDPIGATRALLSLGPDAGFSNYEYYGAEEHVNASFIQGTAFERWIESVSNLWNNGGGSAPGSGGTRESFRGAGPVSWRGGDADVENDEGDNDDDFLFQIEREQERQRGKYSRKEKKVPAASSSSSSSAASSSTTGAAPPGASSSSSAASSSGEDLQNMVVIHSSSLLEEDEVELLATEGALQNDPEQGEGDLSGGSGSEDHVVVSAGEEVLRGGSSSESLLDLGRDESIQTQTLIDHQENESDGI
eukprot:g3246.t1